MFIVEGGRTKICEVYDSTCKKFVLLKSAGSRLINYIDYDVLYPEAAISIGSKIYVFKARKSACLIYDIENDTWSEELCNVSRNRSNFNCVKLPQF